LSVEKSFCVLQIRLVISFGHRRERERWRFKGEI
jgi:hypothetical protein